MLFDCIFFNKKKRKKHSLKKFGFIKSKITFILLTAFLLFDAENKNLNISLMNEKENLSIIFSMKNLSEQKHLLFYKIINELKSSRNFYFIKTKEMLLNENLGSIVENSRVKIIQSNFPDSFYLPLVVSLFGPDIPKLVLFIDGEDLYKNSGIKNWYYKSYKLIHYFDYDYIFGNFQFIEEKKIGCSLLLIKATIIQHLLYYTDSDTTHINPFIQLSLATKTKFSFFPFKYLKASNLENIHNKFSFNVNCQEKNEKNNNSLCIILPSFRRNYFSYSFRSFSNQTYKPKFYVFIQNDSRQHFNLTFFKSLVKEPVYHIWMQNWNSFFFLSQRLSSVFPCDFVMKYDDDQWPIDNSLHEKLIKDSKNKNIITCGRGFFVNMSFKAYQPNNYDEINHGIIVDHCATPFLTRPIYLKLDARNKIYSLYHAEDVSLSVNSFNLCNVTSKFIEMKIMQKHTDGYNKESDYQYYLIYKKEKNVFENSYQYLIHSGYKPKKWENYKCLKNGTINITIEHKRIN